MRQASGWKPRLLLLVACAGMATCRSQEKGQALDKTQPTQTAQPQENAQPLEKPAVRQTERTENGHRAILRYQPQRRFIMLSVAPEGGASTQPLPMKARAQLWQPLVAGLLKQEGTHDFLVSVGKYPELGPRMASAALCSGKWNPRTGKPTHGTASENLRDLFAGNALVPELSDMFGALGYSLELASAEDVVTCRWSSVAHGQVACRTEAKNDPLLPCGAALVFKVRPKQQ